MGTIEQGRLRATNSSWDDRQGSDPLGIFLPTSVGVPFLACRNP